MFVDFETMPEDSRIWIYQADRALTDEEVEKAHSESSKFLTQWTAHGADLKSSVRTYYNRFLVLALDEKQAKASGCSIDSSVHFVQSLGKVLGVDFFNRTKIAFLVDGRVQTETLHDIKNNINSHQINSETLTFNNLIQLKSELKSDWIVPVSESWISRYFKTQKV